MTAGGGAGEGGGRVAVATTSGLAADAAAEIVRAGGNAVDAAIAAVMVAMNTEPGVCALAGGAYVTVWPPDGEPVTLDGNVAMPGRGLAPEALGGGTVPVTMAYGGGVTTLVGPGSVGVPGSLAALGAASERYGALPWRELVAPSAAVAAAGFPLSAACRHYLGYSGDSIFSRNADSRRALHRADGGLLETGETVRVPHLAATLELIASEGPAVFYRGELGAAIADHVQAGGGALTREDLAHYEAVARPALTTRLADWRIATNPPPAIGGPVLAAMLRLAEHAGFERWDERSLAELVDILRLVLRIRRARLDLADDVMREASEMLALADAGDREGLGACGSTVHTSAAGDDGLACAVTASSGYGSGEMPPGTGLWLNNCLGETELNRRGLIAGEPGRRLPSNMAPSVARGGVGGAESGARRVLAIGSPGASRITTALCQVLINLVALRMPLAEAVAHPRLHVEYDDDGEHIAYERGLPVPPSLAGAQRFERPDMYFGGVGAVVYDAAAGFEVIADPRRVGGTCIAAPH